MTSISTHLSPVSLKPGLLVAMERRLFIIKPAHNKPLEWTGRRLLSAPPPQASLPATQGQRYTDKGGNLILQRLQSSELHPYPKLPLVITRIAEGQLNTRFGVFTEYLYYDGQKESIAIVVGDIQGHEDVLCRIHSHCISAHIFNSIECDCREQMEMAQDKISTAGRGIIIWLDQEGRNNGHYALLKSSALRRKGRSQTEAYVELGFEADNRRFTTASKILRDLGVCSIQLMTNNPSKIEGLVSEGVPITGTVPLYLEDLDNPFLKQSYDDKKKRGHKINI